MFGKHKHSVLTRHSLESRVRTNSIRSTPIRGVQTQGDLLATLEIPELQDNINKAKARLSATEQEIDEARANYHPLRLAHQPIDQDNDRPRSTLRIRRA
jgi:hypothetical protein